MRHVANLFAIDPPPHHHPHPQLPYCHLHPSNSQQSSSSSSVMSRLFSKTTHFQKLIFERINLVCLSSFAFGIVCSCLPWGSEILEKRRLLRMVAIKLSKLIIHVLRHDDHFHNNTGTFCWRCTQNYKLN